MVGEFDKNLNPAEAPLETEAPLTIAEGAEAEATVEELSAEVTAEVPAPADAPASPSDAPESAFVSYYESIETEDESEPYRASRRPAWLRALVAIVVAAFIFTCGWYVGSKGFVSGSSVGDSGGVHTVVNRLDEAATLLDEGSIMDFDVDKATDDALEALFGALDDEHAEYMNAKEFDQYLKMMGGSFKGVGVLLEQVDEFVVIDEAYPGSSAEEAGAQFGDVILKVDGEDGSSCENGHWTSEEVAAAIQNRDEGDTVEIVVLRPTEASLDAFVEAANAGEDLPKLEGTEVTMTMTFGEVDLPTGNYDMIGDIGYIALVEFNDASGEFVEDAVKDLQSRGAKAIILDLRDNLGGFVDQAVKIVSLFVEDGDVVQLKGKTKKNSTTYTTSGKPICDLPMVVLINGYSASASEIAAGALRDNGRATIVGTQSYGKGTVQEITGLSFGGAIKYTIAHYLTPNGTAIDGVGIEPDVIVEAGKNDEIGTAGKDAQLDEALRILNEQI